MTPDYVICVGRTPGFGWLTQPSDEQDEDAVIVTTDPQMVARYASYEEAKPHFDMLVAVHPTQQFRMMTVNPLEPPKEKLSSRPPAERKVEQ